MARRHCNYKKKTKTFLLLFKKGENWGVKNEITILSWVSFKGRYLRIRNPIFTCLFCLKVILLKIYMLGKIKINSVAIPNRFLVSINLKVKFVVP